MIDRLPCPHAAMHTVRCRSGPYDYERSRLSAVCPTKYMRIRRLDLDPSSAVIPFSMRLTLSGISFLESSTRGAGMMSLVLHTYYYVLCLLP